MVTAIVDQKDLNGHPVMNDRLKLLKIHLNAAVAGNQDNIAAGVLQFSILRFSALHAAFLRTAFPHGHTGPDGCRQIVSHGGDRRI